MELLLAACVTLFTQWYKWVASKIGFKKAKAWTLVVVFLFTLLGVGIWQIVTGDFPFDDPEKYIFVFSTAIAYYEIIVKRIIVPITNKFE